FFCFGLFVLCGVCCFFFFFFFFQAEDGIRDRNVTGVQTCALPILINKRCLVLYKAGNMKICENRVLKTYYPLIFLGMLSAVCLRSEERRVGKEGRSRWGAEE